MYVKCFNFHFNVINNSIKVILLIQFYTIFKKEEKAIIISFIFKVHAIIYVFLN